jgi:hypothetical protein
MKEVIKTILKILTSSQMVKMFDKDGDGQVSWSEFTSASTSKKLHALAVIGGEIAMKYWPFLIAML